ncbi:hypothetical protein C0995_006142 [Termitomyces sp. Mi166|nr:hypothetical protein C0995_006142 [Termitomyces sp. Mi166\
MAVYLDEFTIQETFLDRIPAEMRCMLIHDDNLSPEVNTVTEFLAYAIRYEQSAHTAMHYDQCSSRCAQGHHQPAKVGTFLVKCSKIKQNHNLQFIVQHRMSTGQKPVQGPTGDAPVTKENWYVPRAGQPGQRGLRDGPPGVNPPRDCKAPKVQVQAAHTAAANSNAEDEQEELINDEEVPPEVKEPEAEDDTESIYIDGDEYVTVNIYDNEYYTREDDKEHLFALTKYQGDRRVKM